MQPTKHERPVIGFLTDFGLDGAAATCRAVMLSICRDAQIVDIAHTVPKYAIREGAFILRSALPWFPVGIHVGIVDPGVGTARRPIAIRTRRGDVLIGPDNGLLVSAADALGDIDEVRELVDRALWLPATSSTFHGRDIFSPVAGHLASGVPFDRVGAVFPPGDLVRLPEPVLRVEPGVLVTEIVYVDSFGNARLSAGASDLDRALVSLDASRLSVTVDESDATMFEATYAPSFGHVEPGNVVAYVDSNGNVAIGANQGDLAARAGLRVGAVVRITRGGPAG